MKKASVILLALLPLAAIAQDDLIRKIESNHSYTKTKEGEAVDSTKKYHFRNLIDLETTSVKNQASSGTCWSYSTNSFLESEMIRMGKEPVELSEMFSAHNVYQEKANVLIRMHDVTNWGDGGECHDVINMYAKYGAIPQEVYTGLQYGTTKNKFGELQGMLKAILTTVVSNPNGTLTTSWNKAFNAVLDAYLGAVPEQFEWKGKKYTPKSFAEEKVGIHPDEYVEIGSFTNYPYYQKAPFLMPDNWSMQQVYNVKMEDLTSIIDNALSHGYTVAWATDVSEKYFSWKNGVAYVPEKEYDDMDDSEKKVMFDGPKTERVITPEMRQTGLDNYATTDDHGMHIVGMAADQNGRKYYKVKNSWGAKNDYKGFLYVTAAYVQLKTTAILLNKGGIQADVKKKLAI
jgi:bleomycin hydrolase